MGEARLELDVSADVPDADVVAYLVEVAPDGNWNFLAFGQLRLRYREGYDREVMLVPGEVVPIRFTLSHAAHAIPAGGTLGLIVLGGNFPLLDPNPHGAGPIADQTENRPALQKLHHGGGHAARLCVPVLEADHG
ncbi:MAG: hypothetical protein K2X68_03615, partial [Novosphingobium sp.]|nr:hypothetical protein [Novosphingobium sp.]